MESCKVDECEEIIPTAEYVDLVKTEEAIDRYEKYMKANPKARENYNNRNKKK